MASPPTPITPTTPTSPNTQCKGYIMAHLHPSYTPTSDAPDPYAVVPCPHPPTIPPKVSERCKDSMGARACWRQKYCDMHWCGACKRVNGTGKDMKQVAEEVKQIILGM